MIDQAVSALVQRAQLEGKHFILISEVTRDQLEVLFELASVVEPYSRSGLVLMNGRILASLFFEPSTRTRLSTEAAMLRLGGSVISEATPLISSAAAKEESLDDMLKVVSKYADVIVLRHFDAEAAMKAVAYAEVPVISAGFGSLTHPTQALLDLYTLWRVLGRIEGLRVVIASADLLRARTGHSLALALAKFGSKIIYAGPRELPPPSEVMDDLARADADVELVYDSTRIQFEDLVASADALYLPGCRVPKGSEERELFHRIAPNYYISLEALQRAKQRGRHVYVMHCLPRFPGEMDLAIDGTDHELYFKQVAYGIPIRMALLLALVGLQ